LNFQLIKMNRFFVIQAMAIALLAMEFRTFAEVRPNSLFSDNAVIQRNGRIPIWGAASDGEKITVKFANQEVSTIARDGKWKVQFGPMKANAKPQTMTFIGYNTVIITNVVIGDVWVAGGQSNMERPLGPCVWAPPVNNWKAEAAEADYPLLRQFYVSKALSFAPVVDANGIWNVCSPGTALTFSAVGYFFGRDLQRDIKVPVGIVFSAWGGTTAEAWMSRESLETVPDLDPGLECLNSGPTNAQRIPVPDSDNKKNDPTVLYNAMIAPLEAFPIKGVIWYQGENNNEWAEQYRDLFPLLISDWRRHWHCGKYPFLFVQIEPFRDMRPQIREAQLLTLKKSPNTAMVVITDAGEPDDIHPPNKQIVGARLALAARALAYGEKIEYSGPLYNSMKVRGNLVVISFTHVGSGLVANGGSLTGFTIAAADGHFVPAKAKIEGRTVVVWNDNIKKPVEVRYGWSNVPDVNLFNKENLPASPFETDYK
jgi:sialate O-acetylesterase